MQINYPGEFFRTGNPADGVKVFFVKEGQVCWAWDGSPLQLDGFPDGRWECSIAHWNRHAQVFNRPLIPTP